MGLVVVDLVETGEFGGEAILPGEVVETGDYEEGEGSSG